MKKFNLTPLFPVVLLLASLGCESQTVISNFGSNPANINAYQYVPANMPAHAPLVLVLHGCSQQVSDYSYETAWNTLADSMKFYVAYGEQTTANNSSECWNYYLLQDIDRGVGESLSLKQITDYMKGQYSIDSTRVFVTGLSAGGAETAVMCCAYPEIFAAGAEMSGLPYHCATSYAGALEACLGVVNNSPQVWGDYARAQNPGYTGNWPRMAIFHGGSSDVIVSNENATEMIKQFTNLHNCGQTPGYTNTSFNGNSVVTLEQFFDSSGHVPVEYYEITNMGHGTAVYPGTCYQQGGNTTSLSFNESFYSPFWAAQFFGILIPPPGMTGITGPVQVSSNQQGITYSVPNSTGATYTWTAPPGVTIASGQGTNSVTVNWNTVNGTISVTEVPTGGCELGPVSLFVMVGTQQSLDASLNSITDPAGTICSSSFTPSFTLTNNSTVTLTSVTINYTVDNNAWQNYGWTGSLSTGQSTAVSLPAVSVSAGTHVLTIFSSSPNGGTDDNPADDTATTNFTAGSVPVVNLGSNIVQCGGSATLNARNAGDGYTWSTGAATQTDSVLQSGSYSVTVTSGTCSASATINVTINPVPAVHLSGGNTCASELTLDAGNSGATFSWSNSASTETIAATSSGTYSVTVTNNQNCSASASVSVSLNSAPVVNLGNGGSVCGSSFPLDAGNAGSTFHWNTGATTEAINATSTGTYSVTVTGGVNCSTSASVSVVINPLPVVGLALPKDTFCSNLSAVTLEGGQPAGGAYSGTDVSGYLFNASAAGPGSYTLSYNYMDSSGCSASASQDIVVSVCTSVKTLSQSSDITIFPNPNSSGTLYIHIDGMVPDLQLKIFDAPGRLVAQKYLGGEDSEINISALSKGIYVADFEGPGITLKKKFVMQ